MSNFRIEDAPDGKLITLGLRRKRVRILNLFYAADFFAGAVVMAYLFANGLNKNAFGIIFAIIFIAAFLVGCYQFLNKATEMERIFVNKDRLDLIVESLFKTKKRSFLLGEISDFQHLEQEKYPRHPLAGDSIDYLGFQTGQQVIQDLHSEGRVSFRYQGRQIRFGKELASWDFNELEVLLFDITGNDFRYTDSFEKVHFPNADTNTN